MSRLYGNPFDNPYNSKAVKFDCLGVSRREFPFINNLILGLQVTEVCGPGDGVSSYYVQFFSL